MTALLDRDEPSVWQLLSEPFADPIRHDLFVGSPDEKSRDVDLGNVFRDVVCSARENAASCGESSFNSESRSEWQSIRVDHF